MRRAEDFLRHWYFWATDSEPEPMARVAESLKEHWEGILYWFRARSSAAGR